MGSRIRSAAFVGKSLNPFSRGAISLGVKAARKCIHNSGIDPSDIGLLIFCGIYRDENIGEPAIASLIQSNLDINLLSEGEKGTFAFDILNSGCGMVTALHVADSHLRSGGGEYAMIVASDHIPIPSHTEGYPFQPGGGALLLERSDEDRGLTDFRFDTYPTDKEAFHSFIEYRDGKEKGKKKGQFLRFEEDPHFLEKGVSGALMTVNKLLERNSLSIDDVRSILPSQSPTGFPIALGKGLGQEKRTIDLTSIHGNLHTAGLAACLESAMESDKLPANSNLLLVNVGSGISVGAALLRT
ncbi:MAG: 3-oxoacyl-[acyl-carrier-protein] synthase III C-terminal domain-containing protein [Candidatus Thermoplasmatota archaeon]|nr:3-oxoacyl-[acyl-carrier-protein] synthase III C-terminal domain-containing protein [Candidatus Thermoplasmatota archaeon]